MSTDKVVLVTGASRGIGQSIAKSLAKDGYTVLGTATTDDGASKISAYLAEMGATGKGYALNVADLSSIEHALSLIADEFQMPNILVNNAGITADNLFMRMNEQDWSKVIDTNLTGVFHMMKSCIRQMIKSRWGRIVNISSVVAVSGNPGQANYCAAKAGVIGMSKSLAQEVASRGVTINVVAPGFIQTDMTGDLNDKQQAAILAQVPAGRMGTPDEIAAAVSFLVSDKASFITGETIHVNGGMYMN